MDPLTVVLVVLAVLVVGVVIWAVTTYVRLVALRNLVQEAWRQIDVELHRRHALVPVLVETVRGHAPEELEVYADVTGAREDAATGGVGPAEQARVETALSDALSRVFAVAERCPRLSASEAFADLQAELTTTEDRIAAGRRFYNARARELTARVTSSPSRVVAALCSVGRAEQFEANDPAVRTVPSGHFTVGEGAPVQRGAGPTFGGRRGDDLLRDA